MKTLGLVIPVNHKFINCKEAHKKKSTEKNYESLSISFLKITAIFHPEHKGNFPINFGCQEVHGPSLTLDSQQFCYSCIETNVMILLTNNNGTLIRNYDGSHYPFLYKPMLFLVKKRHMQQYNGCKEMISFSLANVTKKEI